MWSLSTEFFDRFSEVFLQSFVLVDVASKIWFGNKYSLENFSFFLIIWMLIFLKKVLGQFWRILLKLNLFYLDVRQKIPFGVEYFLEHLSSFLTTYKCGFFRIKHVWFWKVFFQLNLRFRLPQPPKYHLEINISWRIFLSFPFMWIWIEILRNLFKVFFLLN